ncbi:hypothetical protein QUW63_13620 [Pseudoflavonifractor phocaeensis]|uniref:hypothetical protein n=1 Tax=Pseudoflavonifractor phocaeensis TaxID=1870988 RepID=UPI0025A43ED5|nr:hypothetical protein [Pseudoflavonifractor phocaeensis]MDM8240130.1 hypothetical protein [Pseudoflavonifractor phocaeensis]
MEILENLDQLTRVEGGSFSGPQAKSNFEYRCRKVIGICNSLSKSCEEYNPQKTIDSINDYISAGERIIYSEITNRVYGMSPQEQSTFNSNLERLLDFAFDEGSAKNKDIQDIVIRLWDHVHLAMRQVGNAQEILQKSTQETKEALYNELYKEFKGIEKEYITILGIFSTIIISFVAGITFSTSVLENMHSVGIYRLVLVILLIGFVLLNTINLFVRYIFRLNKAEDCNVPIRWLNIILGILLALLIVCWILSVDKLPAFIGDILPWTETIPQ